MNCYDAKKIDKSWIHIKVARVTNEAFRRGVEEFLDFAYKNKQANSKIKCPCRKCRNSKSLSRDDVHLHILRYGFFESYSNWVHHGEKNKYSQQHLDTVFEERIENDDLQGLIHEGLGTSYSHIGAHQNFNGASPDREAEQFDKQFDEGTEKFFKLLEHAEAELFPGCKSFTLLSFIVRLLHVKSLCRWSNNSFTMLLEILKEAFQSELFPGSYHEAWKLVKDLGLDYKKIHACPNDCMLYWKEAENDDKCKHCKTSRYKHFNGQNEDLCKSEQKIPAKVVRYFPSIPRLQRFFMSSKTASLMRWHAEERIDDGKLRHPADSRAWKSFDEKNPSFAADCRNVRLGLAADGFNPFKSMSIAHSTWAVVLIPYNLPPWQCMKQPSFILSTLIDGPRAPGNDIDVYLQPLIDELQELWSPGVPTYDAIEKCMFQLRAAPLWTINDFPAYGNLSGWSTKGVYACPCCNKNPQSRWLKNGNKHCYIGHRRFLPIKHKYRKDLLHFDGSVEKSPKPQRLSGSEILEQLDGMVNIFGKLPSTVGGKRRKRVKVHGDATSISRYNWKKLSIFFQLPYWQENIIHHNLDIMHIEKNFLENLLWTLLGVKGKTKDNVKSRLDLQEFGIRKALHPQRKGDKFYLPPASFTMSKDEKDVFLKVLKNVKVPDGYASNISNCVNLEERNISGLKSHDCHILMQQLLPIALRRSVPKHVCSAIVNLCDIFKQLYSKVHSVSDFECLEDRIALALCELEKIFPPSFFDVMEHLPVHLAEEAKFAGPVHFRSMYPIERYLCTLKSYVRTRSHPEGSIAEGYLAEECMTFCSMYLKDVESKLNRTSRNFEGVKGSNSGSGRPIGKEEVIYLGDIEWIQAHRYVINSLSIVDDYKKEHLHVLKHENPRMSSYNMEKIHSETFNDWFKAKVREMEQANGCDSIHEDIRHLAVGPSRWARRYSGYVVNGLRFHTKQREMRRKTQNSGVFVSATTSSFSSTKDKNPISGEVSFYGVLKDIIELRYTSHLKFVLFKCDWVDYNIGLRHDEFNFTLVNFNHLLYKQNRKTDEPFILASQAQQAWYIEDPHNPNWFVALKMNPRTLFNVDPEVNFVSETEDDSYIQQPNDVDIVHNDTSWARADVEGVTLDPPSPKAKRSRRFGEVDPNDLSSSDEEIMYASDGSDAPSDDDDFFEQRNVANEDSEA